MKQTAKESSRNQASIFAQLVMPLAALVRGDLLALVQRVGETSAIFLVPTNPTHR